MHFLAISKSKERRGNDSLVAEWRAHLYQASMAAISIGGGPDVPLDALRGCRRRFRDFGKLLLKDDVTRNMSHTWKLRWCHCTLSQESSTLWLSRQHPFVMKAPACLNAATTLRLRQLRDSILRRLLYTRNSVRLTAFPHSRKEHRLPQLQILAPVTLLLGCSTPDKSRNNQVSSFQSERRRSSA